MVASMGSVTLMHFTDRLFLARYSLDAISAALPAGIASFTFLSVFMGTAGYTNAFVSQYTGADDRKRVGASLWQGIYFSLLAGLLLALLVFVSEPLFRYIGHPPPVRRQELLYFNILTLGAGFVVLNAALAAFYTGRGLTWTVMWVNMSGACLNIPLDYCLINGVGPFPEWGIEGAAIATVLASAFSMTLFCALIFARRNRMTFGTWRNRAFDRPLFLRLLRYGCPSGVQFFLEVLGFTVFVQMVGRLGAVELAVSNIVLAIEMLGFLPMVGFHIGTATLVGQAVGRGRPEEGITAATSALHIILLYTALTAFVYLFLPGPLLALFEDVRHGAETSSSIRDLGAVLLRFVAVFSFFDALNLVFSGAIKGAGDTRFIMWTVGAVSLGVMILPVYLAIEVFKAGIYTAWTLLTLYSFALGTAFLLRYRRGKWMTMRVIEAVGEEDGRGRA